MRAAAVGWMLGLGLAVACVGPEAGDRPEAAMASGRPGSSGEGDARRTAMGVASTVDPAGVTTEPGAKAEADAATEPGAKTEADAATDAEPRPDALELVFVGDVVLGEYVFDDHRSFAGPRAPADPFVDVAELLRADLVVGNLESPVMHEIPAQSPLRGGHRFGASAPAVDGLAAAGFSVMSLANNHANDLAREGLEQTPQVLRERGIFPVGGARHDGPALRVETLEHRGWRIGLLSATTWLNHSPAPGDPAVPVVRTSALAREIAPLVEQARPEHDLVIVLLHWGRERREHPEPAQIHAAHAFIDAGADLVIGHHPHVLQGIERYRDGLIAYSLGNFLFPTREEAFRDSAVLRVTVEAEPRCVTGAEVTAVRLDQVPYCCPRRPRASKRRAIHERLRRLGTTMRTAWTEVDEGLRLSRPGEEAEQ